MDEPVDTDSKRQLVAENHVVPFQVDGLDVRGRAVQLGSVIDTILAGHKYPEPVSRLLAEAIVLGILLGSSLKFEGRFTIQTQSDGPVSLLVVDFKTPDAIRAYASFDETRLAQYIANDRLDTPSLLGKGVLAMTIDQGKNTQPYQGIVALDGLSFEEIAHQYFRQSEQIPTIIRLATAKLVRASDGSGAPASTWRAGGLIAQFLPEAGERLKVTDFPGGDDSQEEAPHEEVDNAWQSALSLVGTIGDDELCDPQLTSDKLLFRLFHQQGVRVFSTTPIKHQCSCSHEKINGIINSLPKSEVMAALEASKVADKIVSKCEYCGTVYEIDVKEIAVCHSAQ